MSPWLKMVKNFELIHFFQPIKRQHTSQNQILWFHLTHSAPESRKKNKIASAYDSRLNLSKCTFLRCNDQCIDKCPMRIDLLVINWSLPFSFIYHSSLSSKISIYFTSFKVRNKKFKWVLHTVVFYSNAHDILKTCFSNQDSHK